MSYGLYLWHLPLIRALNLRNYVVARPRPAPTPPAPPVQASVVERIVTVWRGGTRARLLALSLFPELLYALYLDVVYLKGIIDMSMGRTATWKHVVQTPTTVRADA